MILTIHKKRVGGNIEYFIRDYYAPSSKVLWLCMDTLKENDVRKWVCDLGVYPTPEDAEESTWLDVLIVTGLSEALLTTLYEELTFGVLVSFVKGEVHKKDHLFNVDTLRDLMN